MEKNRTTSSTQSPSAPNDNHTSSNSKKASPPQRVQSRKQSFSKLQLARIDPNRNGNNNFFDSVGNDIQLNNLFSTRRPRDLTAGLSSGIKNVTKGVAFGAASLIAAPAIGASTGGVGGFFQGLGAGVIMAIALPVAGLSVGITQAVRGVFNTPEAIVESRAGKKWDKEKREWKERWYSLDEDDAEVKALEEVAEQQKKESQVTQNSEATDSEESKTTQNRKVVDTTFYDVLQVSTNATQAEIRKSYYRLALQCHPDKHPDDPKAADRFQQLGEAYQVLGDNNRRQDYDLHGQDVAKNMAIIDSGLFFTMLFGSDVFEPYVGKLQMTLFVENVENMQTPGKITEELMAFQKRKREVQLAVLLRKRIQGYINASIEERSKWKSEMRKVAQELCKKNFGDVILEAVGWVYENYSSQFLGKLNTFMGVGGKVAKFRAAHREMGNVLKIAGSTVKASVATRRFLKSAEKNEKLKKKSEEKEQNEESPEFVPLSEEELKAHLEKVKQMQETFPLLLEMMLRICILDIEETVRKVCKKVLKDLAVPIDIRQQRAEALIELGQIYRSEAEERKQTNKEPVDFMRHVEDIYREAYIKYEQQQEKEHQPQE